MHAFTAGQQVATQCLRPSVGCHMSSCILDDLTLNPPQQHGRLMKPSSRAQAAAKQARSGGGGAAAREGLRQPGGAAPRIRSPTNDSSGRARALNAAPTSKPAAIMAKRRPGGPAAGCKPLPTTDRGLCSGRHAASCSLAGAARWPGSATLLLAWMAVWEVLQQLQRQRGRPGAQESGKACMLGPLALLLLAVAHCRSTDRQLDSTIETKPQAMAAAH